MNYSVFTIPQFDKDIKHLAKKYPAIKHDIAKLGKLLEENPFTGDEIIKGCYKIRMAITGKGKGKRGGARVITHVYIEKEKVTLLSVYDKSEKANLSNSELKALLNFIK